MSDEAAGGSQETTAETPAEPGSQTDEQQSKSEAQFTQSDVDRIVQQALQTREKKLQSEFQSKSAAEREALEREKLASEKRYKELYEREQRQRAALELQTKTQQVFAEKGLGEFTGIFEADLATLDGRQLAASNLKEIIDQKVQQMVNERLKTDTPANGKRDAKPKLPEQMTAEEYLAYKQQRGIH